MRHPVALACALLIAGCRATAPQFAEPPATDRYLLVQPSDVADPPPVAAGSLASPDFRPHALRQPLPLVPWDLSLHDAIHLALTRSPVLRDIGGRLVQSPGMLVTAWEPAIVASHPLFGLDAALAEFDGQLSAFVGGSKLDQPLNNQFQGNGVLQYQQDGMLAWAGYRKTNQCGTRFQVRHQFGYDANNSLFSRFPSAWDTNLFAEVRHPLKQGAGECFNLIAGPNPPGVYQPPRGFWLAQTNLNISRLDFETSLQAYFSQVEDAYWALHYAYRDLDAKRAARDSVREIWQSKLARQQNGAAGKGETEQARLQYFTFEADVLDAESGQPGQSGVMSGLFAAERNLRLLLGLAPQDGRLLRPVDRPTEAPWNADPAESLAFALARRCELRRQQAQIDRTHLELCAARNYLLPRLDVVGQYRWRGLGDDLAGGGGFRSAYGNLLGGDFQEWLVGLEWQSPIGYRQATAAVRNAELQLARQNSVLENQRLAVAHELSAAFTELDRARLAIDVSREAFDAARGYREFARARHAAGVLPLYALLEAERDLAHAQLRFERSRVMYALAVKNLQFKRGGILDYFGIVVADE